MLGHFISRSFANATRNGLSRSARFTNVRGCSIDEKAKQRNRKHERTTIDDYDDPLALCTVVIGGVCTAVGLSYYTYRDGYWE